MSRRREQKSRPEKKPPGRFRRCGPYVVDDRRNGWWAIHDPPIDGSTPPPPGGSEAKLQAFIAWYSETLWMRPHHVAAILEKGELSPKQTASLALRYLEAADDRLHELLSRVLSEPPSDPDEGGAWAPPGAIGAAAIARASKLLERFPNECLPRALLLAALAFAAGFDTGRLHEAELQAAEIVAGDKVRRGGMSGAEKRRKNSETPPTEERIAAWRKELEKERKPDGSLRRGAISRVAHLLAKRFGTSFHAERRFYYDSRSRG